MLTSLQPTYISVPLYEKQQNILLTNCAKGSLAAHIIHMIDSDSSLLRPWAANTNIETWKCNITSFCCIDLTNRPGYCLLFLHEFHQRIKLKNELIVWDLRQHCDTRKNFLIYKYLPVLTLAWNSISIFLINLQKINF